MTQYRSKPVSQDGRVEWSHEEDAIWRDLVTRQMSVIKERACDAYLRGLELLNLPQDRVPQLPEINRVLMETTGWQVEPVPALIDFDRFFNLLGNKRFPVATFLRTREEFDYLQEPDFSTKFSAIVPCSRIQSLLRLRNIMVSSDKRQHQNRELTWLVFTGLPLNLV